ncbi:MAG: CAP domain-containing protein [Chloroflexota bacterium]|nr:CAP domain-containing protein [Chloroflexota bacterium]
MKTRSLSILLMMFFFLLGSACQFMDQTLEEEQFTTQQPPDRPFRPLQATLSAPQDNQSSDSLEGKGEDAPSTVRPTQTGDLDTAISSTTDALLSAINVRRALEGWPPLVRQISLAEIANNRAIDMAVHTYLSHEDPETAENLVESMLIERGYHGHVAELVYAATAPLDRLGEIAIDEWFGDPDTRSVLLNPGFHFIGIGMMGDGTTWKIVQVLAEHAP